MQQRWLYEPEQPKRKHHWHQTHAGFDVVDDVLVGKCPDGFDVSLAEQLVNSGIPWRPNRWKESWPKRIYVVHNGVVYRAVPTVPGRSYHGFPELPDALRELPSTVTKAILARARELGCEQGVREWMEQ